MPFVFLSISLWSESMRWIVCDSNWFASNDVCRYTRGRSIIICMWIIYNWQLLVDVFFYSHLAITAKAELTDKMMNDYILHTRMQMPLIAVSINSQCHSPKRKKIQIFLINHLIIFYQMQKITSQKVNKPKTASYPINTHVYILVLCFFNCRRQFIYWTCYFCTKCRHVWLYKVCKIGRM